MDKQRSHHVKSILHDAILSATGHLPFSASGAKESFRPLDPIRSTEELLWTLDYIAEKYHGRVSEDMGDQAGYLLLIENLPSGHPVFLLGSLYILLEAGKSVFVSFSGDNTWLYDRIIHALLDQKVIRQLVLKDPRSDITTILQFRKLNISHIVLLGDAPNCHQHFRKARIMGGSVWHMPSMHLLIADYEAMPAFTEKYDRFAQRCQNGSVDYVAYRSPTNQVKRLALGFDFMDLFWDASAEVNTWNELAGMTDMIPAIIFTDRPRQNVVLPEGIDRCCNVVFFEDYGCDDPLYDFLQLVSSGQKA